MLPASLRRGALLPGSERQGQARHWRTLAILLLVVGLMPMLSLARPAAASTSGVVISEFRFRGPSGGNDEFVEIFNAGSSSVDISGWKLQGCASTDGTPGDRATVPGTTTLDAGQHFLFTNSAASGYSG